MHPVNLFKAVTIGDTGWTGIAHGNFKSSIFSTAFARSLVRKAIPHENPQHCFDRKRISTADAARKGPNRPRRTLRLPQTPAGASGAFTPSTPSDILQRSLDEVQKTIGDLKLDKWKRGTVRDEAGTNVDAIQRDLQGTLPSLLKDADTAPGSLSKVLPVSRNVDALYDVLVHLVEAARVAAPGDQVGERCRRHWRTWRRLASGSETNWSRPRRCRRSRFVDLRTTVQTQAASLKAAAAPPPAPKCPAPPAPAKKKRPVAKALHYEYCEAGRGTPANPPSANPQAKPQQ